MKPSLPTCPDCGHPVHLHTANPDGSHRRCWWQKYDARSWPCRCGQPAVQFELVEPPKS